MAPNYLKFVGKNRQVLGITTAAGLLNVTLLVVFGPRWGATGAAVAHSISLTVMASVFFALGLRTAGLSVLGSIWLKPWDMKRDWRKSCPLKGVCGRRRSEMKREILGGRTGMRSPLGLLGIVLLLAVMVLASPALFAIEEE